MTDSRMIKELNVSEEIEKIPPGYYTCKFIGESDDGLFWIAQVTSGEHEGKTFKLAKPIAPMEFYATNKGSKSVN